jgi:hypothetical protein
VVHSSNEDRLKLVEDSKPGKLFTCAQLKQIIDTTPSIKTKIGMVSCILCVLVTPRVCGDNWRFLICFLSIAFRIPCRQIERIAPQITDPKAGSEIVSQFRFTEDVSESLLQVRIPDDVPD